MNSVQLQGAGAHPRALCTSSSISASVSLTLTISRYCPLRAISHGPSFSIRIPASFLTFLVTPWSPESMCCILDFPPGAHALSKEPGPSPGGGRQPPASTGDSQRQKLSITVENLPCSLPPVFLESEGQEQTEGENSWQPMDLV